MPMKPIPAGLTFTLLVLSIVLCRADVLISLNQAPDVVQQGIRAHAGSNKILRVEKADEDGQIQYEALTEKPDGKKIELIITSDGNLDSTEERLSKTALPATVAQAMDSAVGDGHFKGVERVTKGQAVTYEVAYKAPDGTSREAVILSTGKLLKNGVDAD